ncbi:MAG: HU family DNA-binding protein [Alphaproteobacteria bacterium]|nr:MAG: HU family DNA-binding protein [Alphaproteobacteria bacterium]
MNKNELVAAVAGRKELAKSSLSKAAVAMVIDALLDTVSAELKKGGDIRLVGFGTFSTYKRAAGEARNPRTGEKVKVKASKQVRFKSGKGLKDEINGR